MLFAIPVITKMAGYSKKSMKLKKFFKHKNT